MHNFLPIICMLLLSLRVNGGPLDDLQANFQTRCDFAMADRDLQIKKLDTSYLAALDRQVGKTKAAGKLEAVLPFINEVEAVKAATDPLPELPEGASLELKQMRAKHAEARAKILKSHAETITSLADKMEAALKTKEQEFTKAGNFNDALAAKKMREDLASNESLNHAREQLVETKPATKSGPWRSLLAEPMEILQRGSSDVCIVSKVQPENIVLEPLLNKLKERKKDLDQTIIAIPYSILSFKLAQNASEARGKVLLANPGGTVHFKIYADEKPVFEEKILNKETEIPFQIQFPPTRQIRLEVHHIESEMHDWSAWVAPEIR